MQTLQYLYNETGQATAMLVDLKNSNIDDIFKKPLNKPQLEILELIETGFNDNNLEELRELLAKYLLSKIRTETNEIWDKRGYTKETFDKFVEND